MSFTVIPAIDLRGGRVVRLKQGDYAQETRYDSAPAELAARYLDAGAQWLHMVDLDGARSGDLENLAAIEAIAAIGLRVQAGGGVRTEADVQRLRDAGVERVVVGSVAMREPERVVQWLRDFGAEHLTVALDTRWHEGRWALPSAGWTAMEDGSLDELAPWYAQQGAHHLLCTDIERDGMLSGFNLALYGHMHTLAPELSIQASGGVRSIADIVAARDAGAAAVILGRALLEGRFTLDEALTC
ncbi:MAG TPA: HisA/HisF-related TIM barrel protein [Dyella sp.]|uniref:1-(5-phosphoribosyl)-5-[(5- phosphoribosylamino)methylideneamino]imidazole-4- carboxamide isomerase n=1 Tax=Dyella sp. TaxID=1869338 RepID=UPI002F93238D